MQVHLTGYEAAALRRQAAISADLDDDGESFAEEAVVCFEQRAIEMIENRTGSTAEEVMMNAFDSWEGGEPEMILETLAATLEELDIELTYDEHEDDELVAVSEWEDDDVEIDDEFEGY